MTPPRTAPLLALALAACGPDAAVADGSSASEHGRWGVTEAYRDGRETHVIDVAYFEFDTAAGTLTTNVTGEEAVLAYTRDARGVVVGANPYFERLDVEALTDSSLVLAGSLADHFFRIALAPDDGREETVPMVEPAAEDL